MLLLLLTGSPIGAAPSVVPGRATLFDALANAVVDSDADTNAATASDGAPLLTVNDSTG